MSDEKMRDDYAPTALESMHNYWKRDVRKTFWILTVVFVLATALFTAVYADDPWAGMELILSVWTIRRQKKQSLIEQMRAME